MSAFYNILDQHWLWKEIRTKLSLSNPAYTYWTQTRHLKLNRYIFIEHDTLPKRFEYVEPLLTDLSGYLPTQYASMHLGLDPHTFNYKQMKLNSSFEYKFVENIKFVNVKRFFLDHGIYVNKNALVQIGKLKNLEIDGHCRFYRLDNDYGVVVYE